MSRFNMHFMLFSFCFLWSSVFASNHQTNFVNTPDRLNSLVAAASPMRPSEKKRFVKTGSYETDGNRRRQQEIGSEIQHSEWRVKMADYANTLEARSEKTVLGLYRQLAKAQAIILVLQQKNAELKN